jgi:glutamate-ammonia-ligase adenylyltransferase
LVGFDIVALGSCGIGELGLRSDIDLLLLCEDSHPDAEAQAEQFIAFFEGLRRHGSPLRLDLGPNTKTPRVRTYASFASYDLEGMELWERCALGNARLVHGSTEAQDIVARAAYALPLTPNRLREIVALRKTLQAEKVSQKHLFRHVKHGNGGLSDLEWTIRVYELRYPTATKAGQELGLDQRLTALLRSGLMNAFEIHSLREAHQFLGTTRITLDLLGFQHDVVPENPDRLAAIAAVAALKTGNEFLAAYEHHTATVRSLYEETLERMHA